MSCVEWSFFSLYVVTLLTPTNKAIRYTTSISYFWARNNIFCSRFGFYEGFFSLWLPVVCGLYVSLSVWRKCIGRIFPLRTQSPTFPFWFGRTSTQCQSVFCLRMILACFVAVMLRQGSLNWRHAVSWGLLFIVADKYRCFGNYLFHLCECGILYLSIEHPSASVTVSAPWRSTILVGALQGS